MFTALITRELKNRFDGLYKQYKDGLCDVCAEYVNIDIYIAYFKTRQNISINVVDRA